MQRIWVLAGAVLVGAVACSPDQTPTAPAKLASVDPTLELMVPGEGQANNPAAHVEFIRGISRAAGASGHGPNPNLSYHGGPVRNGSTTVGRIYWGPSWSSGSYQGDKITGMDTFFGGVGGSPYMRTNIEYTDGSGNHVSGAITNATTVIDIGATPGSAPSTSSVLAVVCRHTVVPGGYYPVISDIKRGNAGYCAWHSAGNCGNTPVQFAFFFDLSGDAGCDPQDPGSAHTQALEALANVMGHELSEMVTDPQLNAWYDRQGAENSDKCAWTFGGNVTIGGSNWKIQGNWSNNAYNAGQGYTRGCIQTA